jgi:hypothetical protein
MFGAYLHALVTGARSGHHAWCAQRGLRQGRSRECSRSVSASGARAASRGGARSSRVLASDPGETKKRREWLGSEMPFLG